MSENYGNIELTGVDFTNPTFKMVGGMSIDDIKIKYSWFLNAEVKDAVIGEDKNGIVWYSGEWIGGIWEGGTWYAGLFHDGRWKKGSWFSYDIDKDEMLKGNLYINRLDISKSQFLAGSWEGGTFNYGIFGKIQLNDLVILPHEITLDFLIENNTDYLLDSGSTHDSGETYYYMDNGTGTTITSPVFYDGTFVNGWMNASKVFGGTFTNGFLNNSCWYNGKFYNGYFLGDLWYDGEFLGGDFSNGTWLNGTLTSYQDNTTARFGTDYKDTGAIWENGTFKNGEFHSKLNIINDVTFPSIDNSKSEWYDGTWENGTWYGGIFHDGTWLFGTFFNGVILNILWENGTFKNGVWKDGIMLDGNVSGGIFENIQSTKGNFGFDI